VAQRTERRPPLICRIRPRPAAIHFRPWSRALDGELTVLAWCLTRLSLAFETDTRLILAAPADALAARQAAPSTDWQIVTSTQWRDTDAWLEAAARLDADIAVAAHLEAALCPQSCWETLVDSFNRTRPGLGYIDGLPAMTSPEIVNIHSASAIRKVAPDEAATHRFGDLFVIAEAAGVTEIGELPCSVARIRRVEPTGLPGADTRIESERHVEWLRRAHLAEEPLDEFVRQQSISIRADRLAVTSLGTRSAGGALRRVLFVSNPSAWSGAESSTVALARALADRQIETAALVAYEGELTARLQAVGCRIFCENCEFAGTSIASWRIVASAIAEWRPDVLHYCGRSGLVPLQVAAASGVPAVYHGHVPFQAVYRDAVEWVDRFIAVSESVAKAMTAAGIEPGSIVMIPNGVEISALAASTRDRQPARQALGIDPEDFLVLTLSRLSPEKRVGDLIEAVALVHTQGVRVKLIIAGEAHTGSGTEAALRGDIQRLDLDRTVRLLGHTSDVRPLLAAADTLALCSDSEGLPMVALEAMAAGVPLIATRAGGLESLVGDPADPGACGIAVPTGDPAAIAVAIARLHTDGALRHELSRRGARRVASDFDISMTADAVLRVYRTLR